MDNTVPETVDIYDGIAPADRAYAEEIVKADPIDATPPTWNIRVQRKWTETVTPEMLPPEMANTVRARLAQMSPAEAEANRERVIHEVAYDARMQARVMAGPGDNATPYHRAWFELARQSRDLTKEYMGIAQELTEVARYDAVLNPETGRMEAKPVDKVQGERREALEARLTAIDYELKRLEGRDGRLRLNKALQETVALRTARLEQIEDVVEIDRRAKAKVREARVESAATARANVLRNRV